MALAVSMAEFDLDDDDDDTRFQDDLLAVNKEAEARIAGSAAARTAKPGTPHLAAARSRAASARQNPAPPASTKLEVLQCCGIMAAKIRIVMKSFVSQSNRVSELIPNAKKIGLPESRALYTVLRSPHIDKKSREQFSMHVKKQFLEQKVEAHELRKKYFWLKRLRAPGAQCEVQISFKTRLDKKSLDSKLLDGS